MVNKCNPFLYILYIINELSLVKSFHYVEKTVGDMKAR